MSFLNAWQIFILRCSKNISSSVYGLFIRDQLPDSVSNDGNLLTGYHHWPRLNWLQNREQREVPPALIDLWWIIRWAQGACTFSACMSSGEPDCERKTGGKPGNWTRPWVCLSARTNDNCRWMGRFSPGSSIGEKKTQVIIPVSIRIERIGII